MTVYINCGSFHYSLLHASLVSIYCTKLALKFVGVPTTNCTHLQVKVKIKVNFTLEQATRAQRGSRDIALLFL
jgi:hypothetical protein